MQIEIPETTFMAINQNLGNQLRESRWLIDGYNLIFQCGLEGRSRDPLSLERARAKLIAAIAARYSKSELGKFVVVFDATSLPIKEDHSVSRKSGINVVFAIDHDDADSLIEELIQKNSNPKKLIVVSSDHRIHKAALRRKSKPIDSDIWFDQLEEMPSLSEDARQSPKQIENPEHSEKNVPQSLADVDWAKEFGLDGDEFH
ncbi:MAG: NYN domain-containing protein [Mariniblastus sp.]